MADEENFQEMERAFQARYEMIEMALLGEGTYGKVYKAQCLRTGKPVAHKKMKLDSEEEGVPSTAIREISLLKALPHHENIVDLLDVFCSTSKLILVFEFVEQDLKKYMRGRGRHLESPTIKSLSYQLCQGTDFLHSNRVIHRDLKPQNLLIDSRNESRLLLKIADFGLARAFTLPVPRYTHEVVTVWYRPPEILLGSTLYSVPVDLWSVGCIVAEMATGQPLFSGDSEIDTIFKIFQKLGTPTSTEWSGVHDLPEFKPTFPKWKAKGWENIRNTRAQVGPAGIELLEMLMAYDPRKRISAKRSLQHSYFADVLEIHTPETSD